MDNQCHYCSNKATKYLIWLKNKRQEPARIKLAWCGCDLMVALRKFWYSPYQVREGIDYEIEQIKSDSIFDKFKKLIGLK